MPLYPGCCCRLAAAGVIELLRAAAGVCVKVRAGEEGGGKSCRRAVLESWRISGVRSLGGCRLPYTNKGLSFSYSLIDKASLEAYYSKENRKHRLNHKGCHEQREQRHYYSKHQIIGRQKI